MMRNPWLDLPDEAPYVLPMDAPYVDAHNHNVKSRSPFYLDLKLIPAPFAGRENADVVILLANPRRPKKDEFKPYTPEQNCTRRQAIQDPSGSDFYPLSELFEGTGDGKWWGSVLKHLKQVVGSEVLMGNIQAIELHGYQSTSFGQPLKNFPSQDYNFELVRRAIARNALIVIPWKVKEWKASVPELLTYDDVLFGTKSQQRAHLSKKNLGAKKFNRIVQWLIEASEDNTQSTNKES